MKEKQVHAILQETIADKSKIAASEILICR